MTKPISSVGKCLERTSHKNCFASITSGQLKFRDIDLVGQVADGGADQFQLLQC